MSDTPAGTEPATPEPTDPVEPQEEPTPDPTEQVEEDSPNKEAAKYRTRLRDTEAKLADTAAALEAHRQILVDHACAAANLDRRLWDAAQVDLDDHTTDGVVDYQSLTDAAKQLRSEMVGGPRPDPLLGRPSSGVPAGQAWRDAFAPDRLKGQ